MRTTVLPKTIADFSLLCHSIPLSPLKSLPRRGAVTASVSLLAALSGCPHLQQAAWKSFGLSLDDVHFVSVNGCDVTSWHRSSRQHLCRWVRVSDDKSDPSTHGLYNIHGTDPFRRKGAYTHTDELLWFPPTMLAGTAISNTKIGYPAGTQFRTS